MAPRINPKAESDHFLHQAIVEGNAPVVERYLAAGGTPNVVDRYDCEPLYTAVKYGRVRIARMLLEAGGDIFRRSKFRGSAWGVAVWIWQIPMIDLCLSAGVNVNCTEEGKTALDWLDEQYSGYAMRGAGISRWRRAREHLLKHGALNFRDLPDSNAGL